ncbi:DNA-binding protein [Micromonospora sp. LH3U1]|uniref:DNA-binding protein n=1 Tax=Micromonospora sp. LH3U1 TaxID=3018339 RepID=UPI00234AFDDE|nr:DNA-binding protein [Micromonospora sp. LH3U1]WCN80031.1 DNA-binding protein [Micromonospora sp. LH3U1]
MNVTVPTIDQVRDFSVTVDLRTAGSCFGIGRDLSYDLARQGAFPVPVLRLGRRLVVTRAALLQALGEATETPDGGAQ